MMTIPVRRFLCAVLLCALLTAFSVLPARAQEEGGFVLLKDLNAPVTAVDVLGGSSPVTVVATQNAGIYSASGTGTVFRKIPAQLDLMRITSILALAADRWLIGTDGDGLWLVRDGGASIEQVRTLDCSRVARIVRDPTATSGLYLASLCTGLHYSADGGVTWKSVGRGVTSFLVTDVLCASAGRVVVATQDAGVFLSSDGGATYRKSACPITKAGALAWNASSDTVYAAQVRSAYESGAMAIAVSRDGGAHWASMPSPGAITALTVLPSGALVAGTADRGLMRWDTAAASWRETAQGAGMTSVTAMAVRDGTLVTGGTGGEVYRADLDGPVAAVSPSSLDLGTIPSNQRRSAVLTIVSLGKGTLNWRIESVPGYMTATPQTGAATPATVTFSVEGDGLGKGPYQSVVKVVTNGGDMVVPVRFAIAEPAPVVIGLTVGSTAAAVGDSAVVLEAPPYIDKPSGRTMVPVRFIAEAFGATVTWDAPTRRVFVDQKATVAHRAVLMVMTVGKKQATVNGKAITLDVAPAITAGRTFVPLRVISETLGAAVEWNAAQRSIAITYMP